jgi:hypothetical protein
VVWALLDAEAGVLRGARSPRLVSDLKKEG